MPNFPTSVFAVAIGSDIVVLDTAADRYLALPGALTSDGADLVDTGACRSLLPEAAAALMKAGLLLEGSGGTDFVSLPPPSRAEVRHGAPTRAVSMADLLRFGSAVTVTAWQLRRGIGCRSFARHRASADQIVGAEVVDDVAVLRETRLVVPSPRRCLPASLIAARFLRRLGHDVEIVFGVRSHPFAAHCWIEAGGAVLDDDLDRVHAFTPIAVGML